MKEEIKRFCESLKKQEKINIFNDTLAIASGVKNYKTNNDTARRYAIERFENHCKNCTFNIEEPIEELKVIDKGIPELTGRTCGECGCILSYKLRQSVKKCSRWEQ